MSVFKHCPDAVSQIRLGRGEKYTYHHFTDYKSVTNPISCTVNVKKKKREKETCQRCATCFRLLETSQSKMLF